MMVRFGVGIGAFALAFGPASAADLPPGPAPMPPAIYTPAPAPAPVSWSGLYIGGNGGYAWGSKTSTTTFSNAALGPSITTTDTGNAWFGGAQIGVNLQSGPLVVGAEGDIEWPSQSSLPNASCGPSCTITGSNKTNWLASARGRIGAAFDRVLVYGTGGGAWLNRTINANLLLSGTTTNLINSTSTGTGWVIGGGVEWMIMPNISLKGEYLYAVIDENVGTLPLPPIVGAGTLTSSGRTSLNIVRVGLNIHFPPMP